MAVSISQLSFEHHHSALGIAETEPRISWRFAGDATNWEQTSYDIEVTRNGSTKSYSGDSSNSLLVNWPDEPLSATEQATVRARAHGGEDQPSTPWSDWVSVEIGLLSQDDWSGAVPIGADRENELGKPKRPIHFRKDIPINGTVESARLYITAFGLYEAEINGKRVGDAVLAPGWQTYNNRLVYDTYDVTEMLQTGDNAIGILVGEGWYVGRIGFLDRRETWSPTVGPIALLRVTLSDGSVISIPTDPTWSANPSAILESEIYNGEIYDSRLEADLEGWSSPGFNASGWVGTTELPAPKGKLSAPDAPPIRKNIEIKPQSFFKSPSGKQLVDFGQNLVGWTRITVEGPAGTNITLRHAEVLEDGELALEPLRSAMARDTLFLHGNGPQTFEPHFTFHGFRYAQITGWPEDAPLDADSIIAIAVWTDMEETGDFKCSHELLSKFHENVRWSMRGNFLSIPTDCPQRNERLGWTGDAHAFGPTSNFLYNTAGFWRGWHRDVWFEMQRDDTFAVPHFVPILPPDDEVQPTSYWGDVAVGNPWNLYTSFGDLEMLKEMHDQARAWIDKGVLRNEVGLWDRSSFQFGDWLDPEAPADDAGAATTHQILVSDAYLVEMTRILIDMSTLLGETDVAADYEEQHARLRDEFQNAWVSSDGQLANRTQTAYALALQFELLTDESHREAAAQTLRDIIEENEYLVGTGFAGTPALGPALQRIGAVEDFYSMLLQTQVPSWLYQVVQNGTTTWERWDSMLANGTINVGTMTSFNHYAFGAVADWIHAVIGGLKPKEPGWKVVEVKPVPGGDITSAETSFISGYGLNKVHWEIQDGEFNMEVTVPPNAKAEVTVPGKQPKMVGSGVHTFSSK